MLVRLSALGLPDILFYKNFGVFLESLQNFKKGAKLVEPAEFYLIEELLVKFSIFFIWQPCSVNQSISNSRRHLGLFLFKTNKEWKLSKF